MRSLQLISLVFIAALLVSCQAKADYSYLMQHPLALQKAFDQCQENTQPTAAQLTYCNDVYRAADNFRRLLREQQEAPLQFGQRIMAAQNRLMDREQAYQNALTSLNQSRIHGSVSDQETMQKNLSDLKFKVDDTRFEINVLLAVLSTTAPD